MAVKTYQLIKLQELGVFYQNRDGSWHIGRHGDSDITEELFAAGMFEH